MSESIIDVSRAFFEEIVKPILLAHFPEETATTAFGVFGYGSEALRLDDELSRDHHWGLRIDALMPPDIYATKQTAIMATLRRSAREVRVTMTRVCSGDARPVGEPVIAVSDCCGCRGLTAADAQGLCLAGNDRDGQYV